MQGLRRGWRNVHIKCWRGVKGLNISKIAWRHLRTTPLYKELLRQNLRIVCNVRFSRSCTNVVEDLETDDNLTVRQLRKNRMMQYQAGDLHFRKLFTLPFWPFLVFLTCLENFFVKESCQAGSVFFNLDSEVSPIIYWISWKRYKLYYLECFGSAKLSLKFEMFRELKKVENQWARSVVPKLLRCADH